MAVISGGTVIAPGLNNPGLKNVVYNTNGVPTDANVGVPAAALTNGMFAVNNVTGYMYERQAGVWTRIDVV